MKDLSKLMNKLGYKFKDSQLLKQALTHSSFSKKNNFERLEFLGDRVLGLVISREIFILYPNDTEGDLAKKISILVCKNTLVKVANLIDLEIFFFVSETIKKTSFDTIKANSMEAIIAAIYLDSDFVTTYGIVVKLWKGFTEKINLNQHDPKSTLQEWSLKNNKKIPDYEIVKKDGPDHNPKFTVKVKINNSITFGYGKNKQDAEIMAAEKALKKIEKNT